MSLTGRYANFDLTTGANDGTSEGNAWQTIGDMLSGVAPNQIVYVKKVAAERYTGDIFPLAGTDAGIDSPIIFRGYQNTIDDKQHFYLYGRFDTDVNNNNGIGVEFFDISGTHTNTIARADDGCYFYKCRFSNSNNGGLYVIGGLSYGCYLHLTNSSSAAALSIYAGNAINNLVIKEVGQSSTDGVLNVGQGGSRSAFVVNNVVIANGKNGIVANGATTARMGFYIGNIVYDSNNAITFPIPDYLSDDAMIIADNVIYSSNYGVTIDNGGTSIAYGVHIVNNAMGAIVSARLDSTTTFDIREFYGSSITSDPFIDSANNDLNLNNVGGNDLRSGYYSIDDLTGSYITYPFRRWTRDSFGKPKSTASFG